MADLRLVLVQTRAQLTSITRNRRAMLFSVVFPVVLMVMFDSVFVSGSDTVDLAGAKITAQAYFTGGMLAYAVTLSAFSTLAMGLITERETGQLKRYRGTPVPAWTFVTATLLRVAVMVGLLTVALLTISRLAYSVEISGEALAQILLYVVLGTATMCSLAIAATTILTDIDSASAALPFITVLLSFISSIFVPVDQLPGWLAEIGRIFPLYHVAAGVQTALGVAGDTSLHAGHLAVLAAWALGGVVVAVRGFRWNPQATAA
jgi:ABC-2 type transport system permease protein